MNTPCDQLLPGHHHCEHGHTNDCPNPGECELLPEPRDLRVRAGVDPTLRAIRYGTDDEAREAYDRLLALLPEPTSPRMFVRFHEYNDNEGENWDWWLQLSGNEAELRNFEMLVAAATDEDDPWHILHWDDQEPESVVDKLVQHAEHGYYASHTKVVGVFTCPDYLGEDADRLYKGGIKKFFKAASDA